MTHFLITICFVFLGCSSSKSNISILGQAEIKAIPDIALFIVSTTNTDTILNNAVSKIARDIDRVISLCKLLGIDSTDIQTSRYAVEKAYDYQNNSRIYLGLRASNQINIIVRDLKKLNLFIDSLVSIRDIEFNGPSFFHSKADSLRNYCSILAVKNAHDIASDICTSINRRLGQATYVSNIPPNPTVSQRSSRVGIGMMGLSSGGAGLSGEDVISVPELQKGSIIFRNRVYVNFDYH